MPRSTRTLLLVSLTLPLPSAAQTLPPTPNQVAAESRREIENSRREARENLERGRRGEIDPSEIRRAREAGPAGSSAVSPEVIARWQATPPQQLGTDPDFVRAMQNEDPAALAHWEGILIEINRDLRADAGSNRWMGGPVRIPDQDTAGVTVGERRSQPPARRGNERNAAAGQRHDVAKQRTGNPIQERDTLERELREARSQYGDAMRRRDDHPGNLELIKIVEREETRVRLAEERYQIFLRENAPAEYRARQQQLDSIDRRMANPRQLGREGLPPRSEPAKGPEAPALSEYGGRQGINPEHRLRGAPDGEDGPVIPGPARRTPSTERPARVQLPEYRPPAAEQGQGL